MDAKYSYSWIVAEGIEKWQDDLECDGQDIPRLVSLGLVVEHSDGLAITTPGVTCYDVQEALGYDVMIMSHIHRQTRWIH